MSSAESVTPLNTQDRVTIVSPHNGQIFLEGQRASVEAWIEGQGINRADLLVIGGGISQQETQNFSPLQSGMVHDVSFMTQPFNTPGNVLIRVASVHPQFPTGTRATEVVNIQVQVRGYNDMSRQELAQEILNRHNNVSAMTTKRIGLRCPFENLNSQNRRSALANIVDTANGHMVTTRPERNNTHLSPDLLRAILRINDHFGNIGVNTIAGGSHTNDPNDEHYRGMAVDLSFNTAVFPNIVILDPADTMEYLEDTWGFRTQRNRGSNDVGVTPSWYTGHPTHFHLSIFGRNL